METLLQIPRQESQRRLDKIRENLLEEHIDALIISDNADIYYACGRVFNGYIYLPAQGEPEYFARRPVGLEGENLTYIRKPEDIPMLLENKGLKAPQTLGLELDLIPYSSATRLGALFPAAEMVNATGAIRTARSVKTDYEIALLRESAVRHERVYRQIPRMYRPGMTDIQLQIAIERASREEGCLGLFRISGASMEIFMANILCGENADTPTPYDFAMGGAGQSPSLPVGGNGTQIKEGMTVMVDANGNYTGYMTDMTRVFSLGEISQTAEKAHLCSIRITKELAKMGRPGTQAKTMYLRAMEIAQEEGLEELFMGHRQKAGFVGHGVGIEVNELPVIAPRSRDILQAGNVIALEPKFVIPGTGAVGIENTYLVTQQGMEQLTGAPEEIIGLQR